MNLPKNLLVALVAGCVLVANAACACAIGTAAGDAALTHHEHHQHHASVHDHTQDAGNPGDEFFPPPCTDPGCDGCALSAVALTQDLDAQPLADGWVALVSQIELPPLRSDQWLRVTPPPLKPDTPVSRRDSMLH